MRPLQRFAAALLSFTLGLPAALAQDSLIDIEVGKSRVREFPGARSVALTDPEVAHLECLTTPCDGRFQVQGKKVGSTDLVVSYAGRSPSIYEVVVHRDLSELVRRIGAIVEGEPPRVYPLGEHIVIQGAVDDIDTLDQIATVATIFDEQFVNLMAVRGDHQVQLEVVFAESTRSGLREIGLNLLGAYNGLTANGGIISPNSGIRPADSLSLPFDDMFLVPPTAGTFHLPFWLDNLGPLQLRGILSILDQYQLSKTIAQPTAVVMSGQEAEFVAGGEVPVPLSQMGMVMVQFKQYGLRLLFVPTVLAGDVIDLRVYIEFSEPDETLSIRSTGLAVPAFATRKARSHVRLGSGMTFAMAGLLQESTEFDRSSIPLLGDIPIVGTLFRYLKHRRVEKEILIFVTPRLVRPLGPGEVPAAPGTTEDNNTTDLQFFLLGLDRRPGSRTAEPAGVIGLQR